MGMQLRLSNLLWSIFLMGMIGSVLPAQNSLLYSVSATGKYAGHLQVKAGQQIQSIQGWGFGAVARFPLNNFLNLTISVDYQSLAVDQKDPIAYWDWGFWERFYGQYIEDLLKDGDYSLDTDIQQRLTLIPVNLGMEINLPEIARLSPYVSLSGGIYLYHRTLTLTENWVRYYPEKDYTYAYTFDNHANPHKGKHYGVRVGIGGIYSLSGVLGVEIAWHYQHLFNTGRDKYFPLESLWDISMGLVFYY